MLPASRQDVLDAYKNETFAKAYDTVVSYGVSVATIGISSPDHCLAIAEILNQYGFAAAVFVDILLRDRYMDEDNLEHSCIQTLSNLTEERAGTFFFATDKNASLYENDLAFVKYMRSTIAAFQEMYLLNRRSLLFVGDLLEEGFSHIHTACQWLCDGVAAYPAPTKNFSIPFRLDETEVNFDMVYHRKHVNSTPSLERLLNMDTWNPRKVFMVEQMLRYMVREMDFDEFIGKQYREPVRLRMEEKLCMYLSAWEGTLIKSFVVYDATTEEMEDTAMIVRLSFDVVPMYYTEPIRMEKEVPML